MPEEIAEEKNKKIGRVELVVINSALFYFLIVCKV